MMKQARLSYEDWYDIGNAGQQPNNEETMVSNNEEAAEGDKVSIAV